MNSQNRNPETSRVAGRPVLLRVALPFRLLLALVWHCWLRCRWLAHLSLSFIWAWWYTRRWKALIGGLPAVLVGLIPLGMLAVGGLTPKRQRLQVYDAAAESALERRDFEAAEIYFRRMAILDESAPATLHGLALSAIGQKDFDRARSLMRRIAPEDAAGHPGAHLWLARDTLERDALLSSKTREIVEHHLAQALAGVAQRAEAHALLGELYVKRGKVEQAIPHLEQAVARWPTLRITLAQLYEMQGRMPAAQETAREARELLQELAKSEPQQLDHRIQLAWCEALLGNFERAVQILEENLTSSEPERIHQALAAVHLRWVNGVAEREEDDLGKQLDLLNRALQYGPDNPQVLNLLANLATRDWDGAQGALGALQQSLAKGDAPATVHVILGTWALEQGDFQKGMKHLELANKRNPEMPIVLNNLAWGLAHQQEPDLERALQLAEAAKSLSDRPEIYHTIGTILARLGRHRQAVTELENALRAFPKYPRIHASLAELYEQFGDAELADLHHRLAERFDASP